MITDTWWMTDGMRLVWILTVTIFVLLIAVPIKLKKEVRINCRNGKQLAAANCGADLRIIEPTPVSTFRRFGFALRNKSLRRGDRATVVFATGIDGVQLSSMNGTRGIRGAR
ncbi:hypothetical protein D8I24_5474 (plasmid) [Cupriavidus necator H850]|uniref:hypothetical protein n=1 Tax=Cupriavidus necator TaxID=106590 RepID=UPI00129E6AEC|nr:hypothetical protein [Cupriavidus necator]KAI3599116.1 hypothetical protein D8I24_5474 [Cupriavidus necator H850]